MLFGLEHEQARTLSDVLLRRTGVASAGYPGNELVQDVAALLRERLGWSTERLQEEIRSFRSDFRFGG